MESHDGELYVEGRWLKPYAEPVNADELKSGGIYFSLWFADPEMLVPLVETLVYIGKDLERDYDEGALYFQTIESYSQGVAYVPLDSSQHECRNVFRKLRDANAIFEFQGLLDGIMQCAIRGMKVPQAATIADTKRDTEIPDCLPNDNELSQAARHFRGELLRVHPTWEERSLNVGDELAVSVPAPRCSSAGSLGIRARANKVWLRFEVPYCVLGLESAPAALDVIQQLLRDEGVIAVRMRGPQWVETTFMRSGEVPVLRGGDTVYVFSWSGSNDRTISGGS